MIQVRTEYSFDCVSSSLRIIEHIDLSYVSDKEVDESPDLCGKVACLRVEQVHS